jgi:hypothetical protein
MKQDKMIEFLEALYNTEDPEITVNFMKQLDSAKKEMQSNGVKFSKLSNFLPYIKKWNNKENQYEAFFLVGFSGANKAANKDIKKQYTLFIDIDDSPLPRHFPVEPSAILSREDGNSHHVYWFLDEPTTDLRKWQTAQNLIINYYYADAACKNYNRLLRIPETYRYKCEAPLYFSTQTLTKERFSLDSLILAHTNNKGAVENARKTIKNMMQKAIENNRGEKLRDGDGRNALMVRTSFILKDYNLINEDDALPHLKWANETFFADQYEDNELRDFLYKMKYAKNDAGQKRIEDEIREHTKKERAIGLLKDWYYIQTHDGFLNILMPHKRIKTKENFNMLYSSELKVTSAVTYIKQYGIVKHAEQVVYEPNQEKLLNQNGEPVINIWKKPSLEPIEKEPVWFINHIKYLFPETSEHEHFFNFIAHMVQKPEEKIKHAIIMIGGQGVGKSILVNVFKKILDESNVTEPSNEIISDKYTSWSKHAQLCFIHEIKQFDKYAFSNRVKTLITDETNSIREMYVKEYEVKNYTNIIAATNEDAPVSLEEDDRRWFIIKAFVEKKEPEYYDKLAYNIQHNCGEVLHWLQNRDISKFNPHAGAPLTESKTDVIAVSKSEIDLWLDEAIENEIPPFQSDIVSALSVYESLPDYLRTKFITVKRLGLLLKKRGYKFYDRAFKIERKVHKFYIIRQVEKWELKLKASDAPALVQKELNTMDEVFN